MTIKTKNGQCPEMKQLVDGTFRLWKGKGRLLKQHFWENKIRLLQWALKLQSGDYFGACSGCNRKVGTIEPVWMNYGQWHGKGRNHSKSWFINEVKITDTLGCSHFCPGGGCAFPKETAERIRDYNTRFVIDRLKEFESPSVTPWDDEELPILKRQMEKIHSGHQIVDEFGEFLPDWKQPYER